MRYHIDAFFVGFLLDLLFGDPYFLPHPIRIIGMLISTLEKRMLKRDDDKTAQFWKGTGLVILVLAAVFAVSVVTLLTAYLIHPYLGMATEAVMTYQILAVKCLKTESMKVYQCLYKRNLAQARAAVSMIVGRDTAHLNEEEIARAAVETVAENTSDGVVAPMLYTMLGGPVLGFLYKAINTMDSMIGYRNDAYLYFGRAAARTDDVANFIPARISALMMVLSSFLLGKEYSGRRAWKIYRRDNRKHASPNSAQTESVCAGALGIRLAGNAVYFGKTVEKPYIGDALRDIELEDIRRVNRLLYVTAWLCEIICLSGLFLVMFVA